jgi:hypothetical protein
MPRKKQTRGALECQGMIIERFQSKYEALGNGFPEMS